VSEAGKLKTAQAIGRTERCSSNWKAQPHNWQKRSSFSK